jgi:hypothetical protein
LDPDPYPYQIENNDPDPYQSEKQDPDPYQNGLDSQHCCSAKQPVVKLFVSIKQSASIKIVSVQ